MMRDRWMLRLKSKGGLRNSWKSTLPWDILNGLVLYQCIATMHLFRFVLVRDGVGGLRTLWKSTFPWDDLNGLVLY
jgi:hypothetical protein